MTRRWACVLCLGLAWALPASCTLDLGPVLDPKDAGSGGSSNEDAPIGDAISDIKIYVLPPGCLDATGVEAQCDPFTNAGCYGGFGCDTTFNTQPRLACLPNDGLQIGDACNLATGPYCAGKLTCTGSPGVCTTFCCESSECQNGLCIPFDPNLGTLGFCSSNATDAGTDTGP
jgi:hypothetical protein